MDRLFKLAEHGTTVRREVAAGVTTFLTMAYIVVVNPQFLSFFGDPSLSKVAWPISASVTATCLASGVMCILMGLYANFPIALASGMGLNAIAAYELAAPLGSFPAAMAVFVIEGLIIAVLVLTRVREKVMEAIPLPMKHAIGVGIGLFIAFIGLEEAGIVVQDPDTLVGIGELWRFPVLIVVLGLFVTAVLMKLEVPGAILIGIAGTAVVATAANYVAGFGTDGSSMLGFATGTAVLPEEILALPDFSTFGRVDFAGVFRGFGWLGASLTIFSVMLSDFFDTMGTVVAIGDQSGMMDEKGRIPRLRRILLVDSLAAAAGGAAGASSVTSYVESAAGIASGGRTGLMVVVVGVLFLLSIFFHPLVAVIPGEATAPALILVGYLMARLIRRIDFAEWDTALPSFVIIILMPLTYSITNGIGAGFITYTFLKMFQGRFREVHPLMYVVTVGFIVYFAAPALQALF
jgi:AGZA family xanthine/uracil permease-like MFS transporter